MQDKRSASDAREARPAHAPLVQLAFRGTFRGHPSRTFVNRNVRSFRQFTRSLLDVPSSAAHM